MTLNPINFFVFWSFDFELFLGVRKVISASRVLRFFDWGPGASWATGGCPRFVLTCFRQLNIDCGWQSCVGSSVIVFVSPDALNCALLNAWNFKWEFNNFAVFFGGTLAWLAFSVNDATRGWRRAPPYAWGCWGYRIKYCLLKRILTQLLMSILK